MEEAINRPLVDGRIGCRRLVAADKHDVEEMVTKYFVPNDIISLALGKVYAMEPMAEFLVDYTKQCVTNNASLLAYNIETGENVGVILCHVLQLNDDESMDEAEWKKEFKEKGCTLIPGKLLATLNKDLGKIIGTKLYLRVSISTVKPSYGRMGIMSGLRKRIELVAKSLGCDFIVSESTSLYTQRIASKLGYTTENEMKYSEYFDPLSGTYIFKHIPAPHQSVKLLVKRI
ncbi:uncharacterized protein LOC100178989 [Ciona intestinalis]